MSKSSLFFVCVGLVSVGASMAFGQESDAPAQPSQIRASPAAQDSASKSQPQKSIELILKSYVADFRTDRFASEKRLFGIEVPGHGQWYVRVTGKKTDDHWVVELADGLPPEPTFGYKIEAKTLRAIDLARINALTAQGKAFAGDYTPMSITQMDGYEPTLQQHAQINPFSFHFWTRGDPEIIPFGEGMTRRAHGSNFVVFYYEPGLRTAWYRVEPGERVHDGPREQAMPFPILAIGTRGTAEGEVDGKRISLPAGNAVFIPANVNHHWWNETDKPAEAILIMFGRGA